MAIVAPALSDTALQAGSASATAPLTSLLPRQARSWPAPDGGSLSGAWSIAAATSLPPGHYLPTPLTPILGREEEVQSVCALLRAPEPRLLTLTGAGGIGKTRLALEAAGRLLDDFSQGIVFTALAHVSDPAQVAPAIAHSLGVPVSAGHPVAREIVRALRRRRVLLVLDSFEHLLPAAPLVSFLLAACAGLRVLVTSRAPLRLSGEQELAVPPLALPPGLWRLWGRAPAPAVDVAELLRFPAVALFVQQAQAVRPGFRLGADNARAVVEICARLDGLPLAIELAAARTRLLPPAALLSRLGRRLALLTGGPRNLPARQRTLRDTLDWSFALLAPAERTLLARLGAFTGPFGLSAVEAIARTGGGDPVDVLPALESLVDNHLVQRLEQRPEPPTAAPVEVQFVLRETVREYALEHLEQSGEADAVRRAHAAHLLREAQRASPHLWPFYLVRGDLGAGRRLLADLLALADRPASLPGEAGAGRGERAAMAHGAGVLATAAGDLDAARDYLEMALTLWRANSDDPGAGRALLGLAEVDLNAGLFEPANARLGHSLALLGGPTGGVWSAWALCARGYVALESGDRQGARAALDEALNRFTLEGEQLGRARARFLLSLVAVAESQAGEARDLLTESLRLSRELGDLPGTALALEGLATVAAGIEHGEVAARLGGAALALREAIGLRLYPALQARLERSLDRLQGALGGALFDAARLAGEALTLDEAVAEALAPLPASEPARSAGRRLQTGQAARSRSHPLSAREFEVAQLVARGLTNRQVGERLFITPGTAGVHVEHILDKLAFQSRVQIAAWMAEQGHFSQSD